MSNTSKLEDKKPLVFVHIPKAAGSTFYQVLNRQYPISRTVHIEGGLEKQTSINNFRKLPDEKRLRLKCVRGHIPFGMHRWMSPDTTYVTILRDPVKRIVSEYHYVRNTPKHFFHSELLSKGISLDDYIQMKVDTNEINIQTRWISGCVDFEALTESQTPLPSNALELAKENIKSHFSVCGLAESFDESLLLMQKVLGWKCVLYRTKNVGKQRSRSQLPSSTQKLIKKHSQYDMELYDFAQSRLDEMLEVNSIGQSEVQRFQRVNSIIGTPRCLAESVCRKVTQSVCNAF